MSGKFYKVVYNRSISEEVSFCSTFANYKYERKYEINKTTFPVDGSVGLFAFTTLQAAKDYQLKLGCSTILDGEGELEEVHPKYIPTIRGEFDEFYKKWKRGVKRPRYLAMSKAEDIATGVVFLKWFKPIKVID